MGTKKREIDLDAIIEKYLNDIDPIQLLIDWQLHGSWYSLLKGRFTGKQVGQDTGENDIIQAIDSKYRWAATEEGVMFQLKLRGYSTKEISRIFQCSTRWVRLCIWRFKDEAVR